MSALQAHKERMNELLFAKSELSLLAYHIEQMIDIFTDHTLDTTPLHAALTSVYDAYEHIADQYAESHSFLQELEDIQED